MSPIHPTTTQNNYTQTSYISNLPDLSPLVKKICEYIATILSSIYEIVKDFFSSSESTDSPKANTLAKEIEQLDYDQLERDGITRPLDKSLFVEGKLEKVRKLASTLPQPHTKLGKAEEKLLELRARANKEMAAQIPRIIYTGSPEYKWEQTLRNSPVAIYAHLVGFPEEIVDTLTPPGRTIEQEITKLQITNPKKFKTILTDWELTETQKQELHNGVVAYLKKTFPQEIVDGVVKSSEQITDVDSFEEKFDECCTKYQQTLMRDSAKTLEADANHFLQADDPFFDRIGALVDKETIAPDELNKLCFEYLVLRFNEETLHFAIKDDLETMVENTFLLTKEEFLKLCNKCIEFQVKETAKNFIDFTQISLGRSSHHITSIPIHIRQE